MGAGAGLNPATPRGPAQSARGLVAAAAARLSSAGVDSPAADAEWLLAHVLGVSRGQLLMSAPPSSEQRGAYEALVRRRMQREPLQHLLGVAAFRHLDLQVGPGVFVPRPETELLIDLAGPRLGLVAAPVVVDLCAGSGALGLSVAAEFRPAAVILVERAPAALRWLRANVAQAANPERVTVVAGDVGDAALIGATGDLYAWRGIVDVVLCNPPYVPVDTAVGPEVLHDPPDAVFAGPDGMQLISAATALAAGLLTDGGLFGVEHDEMRQPAVLAGFGSGWRDVTGHQDLTGRPRFVTAVRHR